jgi:hypothetical protein
MPNRRFRISIAIAEAPIRTHWGLPHSASISTPAKKSARPVVAVQWEHVCDVLVRADDDHAASLADHAAHVEDGGARHLLNREVASGVVTDRINGHPITLFERGIVVPESAQDAPGYLLKGGGPGRRAVGIAALRYRTT